jgi:uncharacterized LabA/DUF88 family protein
MPIGKEAAPACVFGNFLYDEDLLLPGDRKVFRVFPCPGDLVGEPEIKRTIAFVDGQNLYHCAKQAGFCRVPDYDPHALASEICRRQGWDLQEVRFYTGIPDGKREQALFDAWQSKLDRMETKGVVTVTRPLRYDSSGKAREKGIDIRIALDIVRLGRLGKFDVGLIFSQDQDLIEAVHELREIAKEQTRWVKLASAYVQHGDAKYTTRGIYDTQWLPIDQTLYESTREAARFYSKKT